MLSVLVPIYNFDSRDLIQDLSKQCVLSQIEFEIICFDDHSHLDFTSKNKVIKDVTGVQYLELSKNIGRAAIREKLAQSAKYSKLLFLDCDVKLADDNFIKNYLNNFKPKVTVGGIIYQKTEPQESNFILRWKYGIERECLTAKARKNSSFIHFLASNLLMDKELFLSIPRQNDISGYGHEDTWLGIQILEKKVTVNHIDNPVYHIGLDTATDFLNKSISGVQNLVRLYLSGTKCDDLKLISVFNFLKKYKLLGLVFSVLKFRVDSLEKNLKSNSPNLSFFDQWKLYQFIFFYQKLS
ncbi:MAG: glycosyltransferase family 2 protein [Salibacteraceae bacterium]